MKILELLYVLGYFIILGLLFDDSNEEETTAKQKDRNFVGMICFSIVYFLVGYYIFYN